MTGGLLDHHLFVVEVDPHDPNGLIGHLECTEVTAACHAWDECPTCIADLAAAGVDEAAHEKILDEIVEDGYRHGVGHRWFDGSAFVEAPEPRCYLPDWGDTLADECAQTIEWYGSQLTPGRYRIRRTILSEDECEIDLGDTPTAVTAHCAHTWRAEQVESAGVVWCQVVAGPQGRQEP